VMNRILLTWQSRRPTSKFQVQLFALRSMAVLALALTSYAGISLSGASAARFQNLGFEAADISVGNVAMIYDWSDTGGNPLNVFYENYANIICLHGCSTLVDADTSFGGPIEGNQSLFLFGGVETRLDPNGGSSFVELNTSISQVGDVPFDAVSLSILSTGPVTLSMDGSNVEFFEDVFTVNGVTRFMGDISAFTATEVELTITAHSTMLDSIGFSSTALNNPEPATLMALFSAIPILLLRSGRRRIRPQSQ